MDKSLRRALVALIWAFIIFCFIIPLLFMVYSYIIVS